jgi:hypothetical protein
VVSRVHAARGEWGEALREAKASLEEVRDSGILQAEVGALCCIARAHLGALEFEPALEHGREATRLASERDSLLEIEGLLLTARALRALQGPGAVGEVEDLLVRVAERIDESGAKYYRAELHLEAAETARLQGDAEVAEREFARASKAFAERGASVLADRAADQSSGPRSTR